MRVSGKARLCAGTATFAFAIALNAAPALAQCVTDASTVTCSGTVTTSSVNTALAGVPAPSVILRIQSGTTVTRDAANIQPATTSIGTVDIGNAGSLGTNAATVGFTYFGAPAATTNVLTFNNSGTITGQVFASGVGGTITLVNTGTLSGGLNLSGSGDISLTSSGPIYVATGGAGTTAVQLQSFRNVTTTTGTAGIDGVTTNTSTGGAVTANITAPVAIPAAGAVAAVPQGINLFGVGGARLTLNAVAGAVSVGSSTTTSTSTTGGSNSTTVAGTTTTSSANSNTAVGGAANAALGTDARVASLSVFSGPSAAAASIAGAVGSATANGGVNVSSNVANTASSNTTVSNATSNSSQSSNRTTQAGGAVAVDLASTGLVFGSVNANSSASAATIAVAGTVGAGSGTTVTTPGSVGATSIGTNTNSQTAFSNTFATGDFTNSTNTTRAASGGTAGVTVAATGSVFGSVSANGDGGASIDNAGRIRDSVNINSGRSVQTSFVNTSSQVTTPGAAGASTVVSSNATNTASTTVGGATSLVNRAGGVIEDNVSIFGLGNATIDNSGAIFGNVSTSSTGTASTTANSNVTTTSTPATPGAAVAQTVQVTSSSSSNAPIGGSVTGNYGGTIGAIAGSGLALPLTVSQNGQAGSTATIGGVMLANFNASAGASGNTSSSSSTTTTTTQPFTAPATGASETVTTTSSRNGTTIQAANNMVTLTGAIRNNANGTGNLTASTQSGATTVTVTGGIVEGGITATSGNTSNSTSGSDFTSRNTVAATTAGPIPASVAQSSTSTSFNETRGAAGTSAVVLTGATVGGNVNVFGRGAGAGTTGASAVISADSSVAGFMNVSTNIGADQRTDSSTVNARTGATAITQTNRSTTVSTVPTAAGNAVATIAGRVAGANVYSQFGNATAALTGQITGGNSVSVQSGATLNNSQTDTTFAGTSATAFTFPTQTGQTTSSSSIYQGGTAAMTINSSATLQAAGTPAVSGSINVSGLAGSTLSIGAGSRTAGGIFVGFNGSNSSNRQVSTFSATGAQTGSTNSNTFTQVGGAAVFTNAGIVTSGGATVQSIGGASATNTGTIFGTVNANALGTNSTSTTVTTNANDPVLTRSVATTVNTGVGGAASVTNSGVISGNVALAGATGIATNTGVLRNGIALGQTLNLGTTVITTTPTSSTRVATAPDARFAQVYTVNQNGLLIGGVGVANPTVTDSSTGAAATAVLRTTDITATINLNSGSVTTGNITAPVTSATDNTRLTNTTLRLNDTGFLGVGSPDVPSLAVGSGSGPLRFVNTPNYATFAAIDPTLGNSASGTFVGPFISSGSRITGVNLVEKTGAGSFTIVGTSYVAPSTSTPLPSYTMDVGTFRISSGEVQLGVNGNDTVTGASIFGIRGNVENLGGTLLLGRRVTDGATTVVQGTNVRIDGNLTQAAAGTLSVVAAPALVRNGGTVVGALPAQGIFGFGGYGVGLTPFVAYDPTNTTTLRSTPSTLLVNGNVTLSGTVSIAATPGAIYAAGRNYDLLTVSGTYNGTGLTLAPSFSSPFVRFVLTPRTVGTTTVVSVDVARTSYATVTASTNAAAAAVALEGTIPSVISRIAAIRNPNTVTDVQGYGNLQDLATVIAGLDTQVSAADATQAFIQLGSGSVYGSLAAIQTTSVFGEAANSVGGGDEAGVGLWFRPSATFARYKGNANSGASALKADNYGGSMGVNIATGNGGDFGIGGGYGRIDANDRDLPSRATANTYLVGIYGHQRIAALDLSAQAVFGWSNWNTTRRLPLFSRTATAQFDSKEFRINARVGYDFALGGVDVTPFAKIEARNYRFDAFEEQGAGGIGLAVAARKKTVVSPELGLRIGGDLGAITPFVEGSYVIQGDLDGYRDVSYIGDRSTSFRLQGVNPKSFAKLGAGVSANYLGVDFSLRGNYQTGKGNDATQLLGGLNVRF